MRFATSAVTMALLLAEQTNAFTPFAPQSRTNYRTSSSSSSSSSSPVLSMAMDVDVATPEVDAPVILQMESQEAPAAAPVVTRSGGGPQDIRYSEFLKMVDGDKIEKVTFSADGTQLLGVDVDGSRLKIQSLPNDPDLLTQLTSHKVRTVSKQAT